MILENKNQALDRLLNNRRLKLMESKKEESDYEKAISVLNKKDRVKSDSNGSNQGSESSHEKMVEELRSAIQKYQQANQKIMQSNWAIKESVLCGMTYRFSCSIFEYPKVPPLLNTPKFTNKKFSHYCIELQLALDHFTASKALRKEKPLCINIFNQIANMAQELSDWIAKEKSQLMIGVIIKHYRERCVKILTDQLNAERKFQLVKNENELKLMGFENERLIHPIKLIGLMSILAEMSPSLSELISTQKCFAGGVTMLRLLSKSIKSSLLPTRLNIQYRGLTNALAMFGASLSRHYHNLKSHVDKDFVYFFHTLLLITTYNVSILNKLCEFVANIARVPEHDRAFSLLCKTHASNYNCKPAKHVKEIPVNFTCSLQLLFQHIITAIEDFGVNEHQIELLLELAEKINVIAYYFAFHDVDMKCVREELFYTPDSCDCLDGLVSCLVAIFNLFINREFMRIAKYSNQVKAIFRSQVMILYPLLNHIVRLSHFKNQFFILTKLNQIYIELLDKDLGFYVKNDACLEDENKFFLMRTHNDLRIINRKKGEKFSKEKKKRLVEPFYEGIIKRRRLI